MTLVNIKDWLKTLIGDIGEGISTNAIDTGLEHCIGVFDRTVGDDNPSAYSGASTYGRWRIAVLVHWGRDPTACSAKARAICDLLDARNYHTVGGCRSFTETVGSPISLGKDDSGISEYKIEFTLIYNK